jgi:hypothetical protein
MHEEVPNIVCLQVHLPEQLSVSFCAGELIENVVANTKDTTLTAFFKLNSHDDLEVRSFANAVVYQEIPNRSTWQRSPENSKAQQQWNHLIYRRGIRLHVFCSSKQWRMILP